MQKRTTSIAKHFLKKEKRKIIKKRMITKDVIADLETFAKKEGLSMHYFSIYTGREKHILVFYLNQERYVMYIESTCFFSVDALSLFYFPNIETLTLISRSFLADDKIKRIRKIIAVNSLLLEDLDKKVEINIKS